MYWPGQLGWRQAQRHSALDEASFARSHAAGGPLTSSRCSPIIMSSPVTWPSRPTSAATERAASRVVIDSLSSASRLPSP